MSRAAKVFDYGALPLSELADLVKHGHREAFRHIMQRCNQRLFRVARAVMNDDDDAEDALQEAYIKAFQHINGFRGDAQLSTWLTHIVLNECRSRLRRRRPTVAIDRLDLTQADSRIVPLRKRYGTDDPATETMRMQTHDLIERAVASLPEHYRVVFMLRDIEKCSTEETAELLDIEASTVKTRLFRARRKLRKILAAELSVQTDGAFQFLGARCARLSNAVMRRLDQEALSP